MILADPGGRTWGRVSAQWREVDEVLQWLIELVRLGDAAVYQNDEGELTGRITDQGYARAEMYLRAEGGPAMVLRSLMTGSPNQIVLSPTESRVLQALSETDVVDDLPVLTELTKGQVLHALAVLRTIGLVQESD